MTFILQYSQKALGKIVKSAAVATAKEAKLLSLAILKAGIDTKTLMTECAMTLNDLNLLNVSLADYAGHVKSHFKVLCCLCPDKSGL